MQGLLQPGRCLPDQPGVSGTPQRHGDRSLAKSRLTDSCRVSMGTLGCNLTVAAFQESPRETAVATANRGAGELAGIGSGPVPPHPPEEGMWPGPSGALAARHPGPGGA